MGKTRISGQDVRDTAITDADVATANKDGTTGTPSLRTLGTGAQQAAAGNDARLSDARAPTAHKTSHQDGGSDEIDLTGLTGLVTDHGALSGLADDDHPQYLTPAEGNAAYDALGAAAAAQAASQPLDSDLTAIAALTTTSYGRSLLEAANAAALRVLAGTIIGTDVQAFDADLAAIAALTTTSYGRSLLESADAAAARTLLALGSFATISSLAHSATTGQTTDDHHAKVHAHTSAGEGGTIAHAATTGQTATDHHAAPVAGPDADVAIGAAGAAGTAGAFARSAHGHRVDPDAGGGANATIDAAGTTGSGTALARSAHGHRVDTTAGPGADVAIGAAGAAGATGALARAAHGHRVDPDAGGGANDAIDAAATAGTATALSRGGHGHRVDSTAGPGADTVVDGAGAAGATGALARAAHGHRVDTSAANPVALGAAAPGATGALARALHVHPTTGLSLTGHGAADHADVTRKLFLSAAGAKLDTATAANLGASPDLTGVVAYADAATQGAFWTFEVPDDWASGVITIQPVWSPGATDAVAHTVRWSLICKTLANGVNVVTAGTTVTFTGASAARTASVLVYDTATSTTLSPAAAGDLFRVELRRIGADAADTYVGVVNLLGIIVSYTANE